MAPAKKPHHQWVHNEGHCSCYGVAVITRNTSAVGHGFDYRADGARRSYAMGCKRASLRTPFAPANRIFVLAAEALPLKREAKASPAKARRYSRWASGTDRFATASECPVQRLLC